MAPKKRHPSHQHGGFGKVRLRPELQKAEALIIRKQFSQAKQVLESLDRQHPGNPDVLSYLVNIYLDLSDMVGYTYACERLLQADPRNAHAAYGLCGGYMTTMHPLLALQALRYAVERFPNHERAAQSRTMIGELESSLESTLQEMGLSGEEGEAIARLHEQGQVHMERGHMEKARQVEQEVIQRKPDFLSAWNNLSLIYFTEKNFDQAIATAQQVLDQEPDNIHALSNLTRFCCSQGEWDQARVYGDRLKASQAQGWDAWTKKAEALSYLGDDADIIAVFEQAKQAEDLGITSALFHHLVAVALARSGQLKEARKQWQEALKKSPGLVLAQANLDDLDLPIGQRHGPWAFDLPYWLNQQDLADLLTTFRAAIKSKDESAMDKAMQRFLDEHPNFVKLIPVLLDRGDPAAREFALRCASRVQTPELLEALRDFALSQSGTDAERNQAATTASNAGLLSPEKVRMWIQGEWREIMLIAYELHHEPPDHAVEVLGLLEQVIPLLKEYESQAAASAEQLLQQALTIEPDQPDLLNNLAVAYEIQGRHDEAMALIAQIVEQHPDYIPAQVSMANYQMLKGDLEAAEAILKPLVTRKRFHGDDFAQFCQTYIRLLLMQKQIEGARGWFQLWQQVDPDNPELADLKKIF